MRGITKVALVVGLLSAGVASAQASNGEHKVLLCHATSSESNPYELISVDVHGAAGHLRAGHGDSTHTDFLLPAGRSDCSDDGGNEE